MLFGAVTVAFGGPGAVGLVFTCAGTQSAAQLAMQALGAALGSCGMHGIDYAPILGDMVEDAREVPRSRPREEAGGPGRRLGVRLAGAAVGALLARLAFSPGLDFSLIVSSLLIAVSSVLAAIATEEWADAQSDDPIAGVSVTMAELQRVPETTALTIGNSGAAS